MNPKDHEYKKAYKQEKLSRRDNAKKERDKNRDSGSFCYRLELVCCDECDPCDPCNWCC